MREAYRAGSRETPRSTAQTINGLTREVSGLTTIFSKGLPLVWDSLYCGGAILPLKMLRARAMPSRQSMS